MIVARGCKIYREETWVPSLWPARHTFYDTRSWPLIGDDLSGGRGIPQQLPAIGTVVVIKLAGHADDGRLIVTDVLPAVQYTGRNDHQTLISSPQHKLIDAAEGGRSAPAVIAYDTERAGCSK